MKELEYLKKLLQSFEASGEPISETDVSSKLREMVNSWETIETMEVKAENLAFGFSESLHKSNKWQTYYGPKTEMGDFVYPDLEEVTPQIIKYWSRRAQEAFHSIFKARYFGLVWEFSMKVTGKKANYSYAISHIEANLEIATKRNHKLRSTVFDKLERAISLSISLRNTKLTQKAIDIYWEYEKSFNYELKGGFWGWSMGLHLNKKEVSFSEVQLKEMVRDLEKRLALFVDLKGDSIEGIEKAVLLLANYYQKEDRETDFQRALKILEQKVIQVSESKAGFQKSYLLERLLKTFRTFEMKDKVAELLVKIRQASPSNLEEMKPIRVEWEDSLDEMEERFAPIINGENPLSETFYSFIPNIDLLKKCLDEGLKSSPTMALISKGFYGEKGRKVSSLGSYEENPQGHLVRVMVEEFKFRGVYLHFLLMKVVEGMDNPVFEILEHLNRANLLQENRVEIIREGLVAYMDKNYLVAMHLLIPQFENLIRELLERIGGAVLEEKRDGAHSLKTFDKVLRDPILEEFLGKETAFYFRTLFTDQLGWNLRNRLCHGMMGHGMFNATACDRVIHALLAFGEITTGKSEEEE